MKTTGNRVSVRSGCRLRAVPIGTASGRGGSNGTFDLGENSKKTDMIGRRRLFYKTARWV